MLGMKLFGAGVKFVMVTMIAPTAQTPGGTQIDPYPTMEICQTDLELAPTVANLTGRACMSVKDYSTTLKEGKPLLVYKTTKQLADEANQQAISLAHQQQVYNEQLAEFKKATAQAEQLQEQIDAAQQKYDEQLEAAKKLNAKKK
jgi:hypothetical protein